MKGRKLHLLTDTTGNPLSLLITKTNFADVHAVSYLLYTTRLSDRKPQTILGESRCREDLLETIITDYYRSSETIIFD